MNVFISWSGPRSEALALFMRDWLGDLIQATKPWMSSKDLRKGQAWFPGIGDRLKDMAAAIVCVTPENMHEDWLLFEAGAAAGPGHSVFTYLIDLKPTDVTGPLKNFQHTSAEKGDTFVMVKHINEQLGDDALEGDALKRLFERQWPELEKMLEEISGMETDAPQPEARKEGEMLAELLELSRQQSRVLERLKPSTVLQIGDEPNPLATRWFNMDKLQVGQPTVFRTSASEESKETLEALKNLAKRMNIPEAKSALGPRVTGSDAAADESDHATVDEPGEKDVGGESDDTKADEPDAELEG